VYICYGNNDSQEEMSNLAHKRVREAHFMAFIPAIETVFNPLYSTSEMNKLRTQEGDLKERIAVESAANEDQGMNEGGLAQHHD
jgi:hypothetical protein